MGLQQVATAAVQKVLVDLLCIVPPCTLDQLRMITINTFQKVHELFSAPLPKKLPKQSGLDGILAEELGS
jgi:hypothetical protein